MWELGYLRCINIISLGSKRDTNLDDGDCGIIYWWKVWCKPVSPFCERCLGDSCDNFYPQDILRTVTIVGSCEPAFYISNLWVFLTGLEIIHLFSKNLLNSAASWGDSWIKWSPPQAYHLMEKRLQDKW